MLMPTRSVAGFGGTCEPPDDRQPVHHHRATEASAPTAAADRHRPGPPVRDWFIYLLFNGTSSTIAMQYPWGLTLVAFFKILIFIVVS